MEAFLYLSVPFLYVLYVVCISFIGRQPKLYSGDEKWIFKLAQCLWFLCLNSQLLFVFVVAPDPCPVMFRELKTNREMAKDVTFPE